MIDMHFLYYSSKNSIIFHEYYDECFQQCNYLTLQLPQLLNEEVYQIDLQMAKSSCFFIPCNSLVSLVSWTGDFNFKCSLINVCRIA